MSMAVAISALVSAYTAVRIQLASTRTSVDTHAPLLTDDSAAATCLRSSRVTRRTKTIRVKGAHVFSSCSAARLCRTLLLSSERVSPGERSLGEYLLRYTGQLCARLPHRLPRPTPGPSRGRYRVFVALPLEQIFDPER